MQSSIAARLLAGETPQIIDVRNRSEWDAGRIEGSMLKTWHDITSLPEGLHDGEPILVVCASGQRAATAASLLLHHGAREVVHVVNGGVPALGRLGVALTRQ